MPPDRRRLFLVDDMGFADLGIMWSVIRTPNIDALVCHGVLLISMYDSARCCRHAPASYLIFIETYLARIREFAESSERKATWQIQALTQSQAGSKSRRQRQIISPGCARGSASSER
jgi:hypothetical protein